MGYKKFPYKIQQFPIQAKCPLHHDILDLTTRITLDEPYTY